MISLLATWMRNPPYFWIRANASDSPRHSALSCDFRSPLRPSRNQSAHVRKRRLVIGTVRQDYAHGATRCRTQPDTSGTVSERHYTIYGNRRFVCNMARPSLAHFFIKFSCLYTVYSVLRCCLENLLVYFSFFLCFFYPRPSVALLFLSTLSLL